MTLENQLSNTVDRLCEIKTLLRQGKAKSALLTIKALGSSLDQALVIRSLEQCESIEQITCDDYPRLAVI